MDRSLRRLRAYQPPRRTFIFGVAAVPSAQGVFITRLLQDRQQKIMRERMSRQAVLPGVPAPPTVAQVLFPVRPRIRPPARVPAVRQPLFVHTARQIVPSSTPTSIRIPIQPPPRAPGAGRRAVVPGVPAVPTVGFVHVRRAPVPVRATVYRLTKPPVVLTAVPAAVVIVCTTGTWSAVISFLPCDDYRLELDGPAADDVKASVNMEFEE